MKLQNFLNTDRAITVDKIDQDRELAIQIQVRLIALNLLESPTDGLFQVKSKAAFYQFQTLTQLPKPGVLDAATAKKLIEAKPEDLKWPSATHLFTVPLVKQIFFDAPAINVEKYLPIVLKALDDAEIGDRDMVLVALGTIRAETAGFEPISEFQSRYNTAHTAFDLYDAGTALGERLGNKNSGDGARFKGRGFIQLTGRYNYTKYSQEIGLESHLVDNPSLANDPVVAARLLARFLKQKQPIIRRAFAQSPIDYRTARKAVNGGSHGLDRFQTAIETGYQLLHDVAGLQAA